MEIDTLEGVQLGGITHRIRVRGHALCQIQVVSHRHLAGIGEAHGVVQDTELIVRRQIGVTRGDRGQRFMGVFAA